MKLKFSVFFLLLINFSCSEDDSPKSIEDIMHFEKTKVINNTPHFDSISYYTILSSGISGKQYALGSICYNSLNEELITAFVGMSEHHDLNPKEIYYSRSDLYWDFQKEKKLQENIGEISIGSPNLLYLGNQHLMLIFTKKNSAEELDLMWKESLDNGSSWSEPKFINQPNSGYYIINNDRAVYRDGVIWLPVSYVMGDIYDNYHRQEIFLFYSTDLGKTWNKTEFIGGNRPLMEPGLTFLSNGEMLINIRTRRSWMEMARSSDQGQTWVIQNRVVRSPQAPQTIINYNNSDTLYMVYNSNSFQVDGEIARSPLSLAISTDQGHTWQDIFLIEEKSTIYNYSYPSITQVKEKLFITYYKKEIGDKTNTSLKGLILH